MESKNTELYWKRRAKHGRNKIFEDPEDLWEKATEYFQWVTENPLYETKAFHNQGEIVTAEVPKMRPMTIQGLLSYINLGEKTWYKYKDREDFVQVTETIDNIIRNQKFEGAASGFFNSNIIARDLGLSDYHDVDVENKTTVTLKKKQYDGAN